MSRDKSPGRDPAITSKMMARVKSKNSRAELIIRRMLFSRGHRYRVHYNRIPGQPDIVFTRKRVAIFVDGDFWHGNSWRLRGLSSLAAQFPNRTEWWVTKIERTIQRDREVTEHLLEEGWIVLRFWESDVLSIPNDIVAEIEKVLS